jgi:Ner family transcriptional regulator
MVSKIEETNGSQENTMSVREWVKFRLHLKGYTLRSFGRLHGLTAGSVGVVFYRPYPRMERLIASALEIQPWELWPSRYDENQKPNRPNLWYQRKSGGWKPKAKNTTSKIKVNGENLSKIGHEKN